MPCDPINVKGQESAKNTDGDKFFIKRRKTQPNQAASSGPNQAASSGDDDEGHDSYEERPAKKRKLSQATEKPTVADALMSLTETQKMKEANKRFAIEQTVHAETQRQASLALELQVTQQKKELAALQIQLMQMRQQNQGDQGNIG